MTELPEPVIPGQMELEFEHYEFDPDFDYQCAICKGKCTAFPLDDGEDCE